MMPPRDFQNPCGGNNYSSNACWIGKVYLPGAKGYVIYHPRDGAMSHTREGQVNNMLIFQLLTFSHANIGNLEGTVPLYVNYRQVIPQGLWIST